MKKLWDAVKEEIMSLKKYGITDAIDGTEGDALVYRSDLNSSDKSHKNGDIYETVIVPKLKMN